MPPRLADRLAAARLRRFVGREGELEWFRSLLAAPELPTSVVHYFGPGGVGKSMLLQRFARLCAEAIVPVVALDARHVEATPDALLETLRAALGCGAEESPLQALAAGGARRVVLLDTYETLAPLDGWMRETFLPQLPENVLVVLAGRGPLAPEWRADPGWQTLIRSISLRNLRPDESRAYLTQRQVPGDQHRAILDFTHGHPLALSLVADAYAQRGDFRFQPEEAPDIVKTLLEQFVHAVPGPAHRTALEACALVRLTTEALLAAMLDMPDVHELFDWLRGLSFVESGQGGLFPHDLAREALDADLRWRNPDWYAELHRRARGYYARRLQQPSEREQQRVLFDYVFLHRHSPVVRPFMEWQEAGAALPEVARPSDAEALAAMVARHEGGESARLLLRWLGRQPQGVLVLRDGEGLPAGLIALLALHDADAADLAADPGARAAWEYLRRRAPLRPGEGATLFRFWMARDTYQGVSPAQSLIFITMVRHYLTPGHGGARLAFTFIPCADPAFWAPMFAYADLARLPEADFEVGGRSFGVYGHDWRAVPPLTWLELLGERETADTAREAPPGAPQPLLVLSQPEFASAVRDGLRDFAKPEALRTSPLLRSRLVVERVGPGAGTAQRAAALRELLREACEALRGAGRDAKLYRALHATYLQPATTQERAAELLDLPFSTYRRHLKAGIEAVAQALWRREVGGAER